MNQLPDPHPPAAAVASPCIGICDMDRRTGLCRGCARTIGEIAEWGMASEARRRAILDEVARRTLQQQGDTA